MSGYHIATKARDAAEIARIKAIAEAALSLRTPAGMAAAMIDRHPTQQWDAATRARGLRIIAARNRALAFIFSGDRDFTSNGKES